VVGTLLALLALVHVLGGSSAPGAFSGANGKIAFHSPQGGMAVGDEVRTINPDGSGVADVMGTPVADRNPAWSPSGLQIAFERVAGGDTEIWVVNVDGTNAAQLTSGQDDARPAWSGDSTKIVFERGDNPGFDNDIWVMNSDGSGETQLTFDPNDDFQTEPVFNSAGTKIAYTSGLGQAANFADAIYVMNADGTGAAPVTPTDGSLSAGSPDFSPDDSRLTFHGCDDVGENCTEPRTIWTMPAGGGPATEVTDNTGGNDPDDLNPVFSPDGAQIAFASDDFANSDIFRVPAGGGTESPVTTTGNAQFPDWQPIAVARAGAVASANMGKCQGVPVTIHGDRGDDVINGTAGRDVIHGLRGDDVINGLEGDDRLCGGRGADRLFGGLGDDVLFGGDGIDFLDGGTGPDDLFGGTPKAPDKKYKDTCRGGKGKDKFQNCQSRSG
jgi:Ca2+-binding RTX toxin-like protein